MRVYVGRARSAHDVQQLLHEVYPDQHPAGNRTMQPTVPSWAWLAWDRRVRNRAGEYARAHDRAAQRTRDHDKYPFYIWKEGRHLFRSDPLHPLNKNIVLNLRPAASAPPVTWRVDRYHDTDPWRVPDIKSIQGYRPYEPVSIVLPASAGAGGAAGAAGGGGAAPHGWGHAARGWAAGAVVLALLMLIVRAAENCLHRKLFKVFYMHTNVGAGEIERDMMRGHYHLHGVRRQDSEEWSRPNVRATSLQQQSVEVGALPRLDDSDVFSEPAHLNNDLPPPYSECATSRSANIDKYMSEEPPPPYSACYVSYANPKDGESTVRIHDRRRQNLLDERAHSSTELDNVQNDLIENGLRMEAVSITPGSDEFETTDSGRRTELVFDNGRIVERASVDLNSNASDAVAASTDNLEERIDRDNKDNVVYNDEITAENSMPGRVLLV